MIRYWAFVFTLLGFWKMTGAAGTDPISRRGPWLVFLIASLILGAATFWRIPLRQLSLRRGLPFAGLLGLAAIICPFPWCIPPGVLALGALFLIRVARGDSSQLASPEERGWGEWAGGATRLLARAFLTTGGILTIQAIVVALLPSLLARRHEVPVPTRLLAFPLHALGFDAQPSEAGLSLSAPAGSSLYTVRLENLLVPSFALVAVSGMIGLLLSGRRGVWSHLGLLLVIAVYALLRFDAVAVLHLETQNWDFFLEPHYHLLSLAPLLLFLAWRDRKSAVVGWWGGEVVSGRQGDKETDSVAVTTPPPHHPTSPRRLLTAFAACVAGVILVVFAWHAPDPGTAKQGRILIDEYHSNWESSEEPLATRTYGMGTTYTYRVMADYLSLHYPTVERNKTPFTRERLRDYDILILKTPTRPYDPEEVRAVVEFVEAGGGLWLIGDHTNVFGMGTYLNQVGKEMGIRFLPDATADLPSGGRQLYQPPAWFAHPIVAHMETMLFATTDSLAVTGRSQAALVGQNLFADDADYSVLNFFSDFKLQPHKPYGLFLQLAARDQGRGRVVAFTDSTPFSSFSFHYPGVYQLALGTTEWLNRKPLLGSWFWLSAGSIGLMLLILGLSRLRGLDWDRRCLIAAAAMWISVAAAALLHGALVRACYPLPTPARPYQCVAFPTAKVGYRLPLDHETHWYDADNYDTFFISIQRLGLVPRVYDNLDQAINADVVVIADRIALFTRKEIMSLHRYVSNGGKLLIMDHASGGPRLPPDDPARYHQKPALSTSELILHFGFAFGDSQPDQVYWPVPPTEPGKFTGIRLSGPLAVQGGRPALVSATGVPIAAVKNVGHGRVAVFGGSRAFAVVNMGRTVDVPNENQLAIHHLGYWLFTHLLETGRWKRYEADGS